MKINKLIQVLLSLVVVSFVLVEGLIIASANKEDDASVDYLLILGAGIDGDKPRPLLQSRLEKGLQYLDEHPNVEVVLSGGQGVGGNITEAEVMERYLLHYNVPAARIIKEEQSTSTYENIKFTRRVVVASGVTKEVRLMIITSDFHMFRAKLLAQSQGFIAYGLPADTPRQNRIYCYLREYLAVIKTITLDLIIN